MANYADGWNYGLCSFYEYLEKTSILKQYFDINNNNDNNTKVIARSYQDISEDGTAFYS